MEDVYFELNLQHRGDRENPVYAGWLEIFECLGQQPGHSRRLEGSGQRLQSDIPGIFRGPAAAFGFLNAQRSSTGHSWHAGCLSRQIVLPCSRSSRWALHQRCRRFRQFGRDRFLHALVHRAVVLQVDAPVPDARQHAQPAPLHRQSLRHAAEQQNLLRPRIADARELLERLLRLVRTATSGSVPGRHRTAEFVIRAISCHRNTRVSGRIPPSVASGSRTSRGALAIAAAVEPGLRPQSLEDLRTPLIGQQIAGVLPQRRVRTPPAPAAIPEPRSASAIARSVS